MKKLIEFEKDELKDYIDYITSLRKDVLNEILLNIF